MCNNFYDQEYNPEDDLYSYDDSQYREPYSQIGSSPPNPPPNFIPQQQNAVSAYAVGPSSIRPCLYKYTYLWLRNRRPFWTWLNHMDRRSVSGWRWSGRRWVYFGVDLRMIDYFVCF